MVDTIDLSGKFEFEDFNDCVRAHFMKIFYFDMEKELFEKKKENERKLAFLINSGMSRLRNSLSNHTASYIHKNSGIPLVGSNSFGLVDRNTSVIEVKPITGCNLNCIFCSVDEGISTAKANDFVVEVDYLIEEFKKLAEFKGCKTEANINPHGEPLLYSDLPELVKGLSSIQYVNAISMNTNGTLLNKALVDRLCKSGLTRFNISLNAIEPKTAVKLAGSSYDIGHVLEIAAYISKNSNVQLLFAPVLVPGINESEMPKIVELAKKLKAQVGIQNFLNYRFGRNPAKQMAWSRFYSFLEELERKQGVKLVGGDFGITRTRLLPKPFRKGETINAVIACHGRYNDERIAVADNRNITIQNCIKTIGSKIRIKITRNKHNIFYGRVV